MAALALPSGMAYAEVAKLPPVNGRYALLLPTVLYTFLSSCRQLIVGPESMTKPGLSEPRWAVDRSGC